VAFRLRGRYVARLLLYVNRDTELRGERFQARPGVKNQLVRAVAHILPGDERFNDLRDRCQDNHLGKGRRYEDPLWFRVDVVSMIVD